MQDIKKFNGFQYKKSNTKTFWKNPNKPDTEEKDIDSIIISASIANWSKIPLESLK